MTADLIGKQVKVLDKGWIELVDLLPHPLTGVSGDLAIVNAARVSFMGESKGPEKDKKLLFYLLRHRHTTPFEMVEFKFRVRAPLVTWWQWVRHRTFSMNAQCLDGDTEITFNLPHSFKQGTLRPRCEKLSELHRKWHLNTHNQYPRDEMLIRVLNEDTMLFESGRIADVVATGKKQAFRVSTQRGYSIVTSADHRFLFENGWKTLQDATGLHLLNDRAMWTQLPRLHVNGIALSTADLYTDPKWLESHYCNEGLSIERIKASLDQITNIEYLGERDMYDIAIAGEFHNYVADGFVVHNSGRYTPFEEGDFYVPDEWRKQAASNKQASDGVVESGTNNDLTNKLLDHYARGFALYEECLQAGVAKEQARLFLPGFSVYYTWVLKVDAHNLMHFLKLRMAAEAQYEIRVYAQAIYDEFFKPALPWTAEAFEEYVLKPQA